MICVRGECLYSQYQQISWIKKCNHTRPAGTIDYNPGSTPRSVCLKRYFRYSKIAGVATIAIAASYIIMDIWGDVIVSVIIDNHWDLSAWPWKHSYHEKIRENLFNLKICNLQNSASTVTR